MQKSFFSIQIIGLKCSFSNLYEKILHRNSAVLCYKICGFAICELEDQRIWRICLFRIDHKNFSKLNKYIQIQPLFRHKVMGPTQDIRQSN
jgi:hypothetical protein